MPCVVSTIEVYNYSGTDEQYYYGTKGSQFELRRDELMKVMKDTSLSYEEKAQRMEDIRLKYRSMNNSKEAEDADSVAPALTLSESTSSSSGSDVTLDDQRRAELQSILRDKSLSKDERRLKMKEVKEKYSAMTSIEDELAAFCKTKKKNKGSAKLASTVLKSFSLGNEKKAAEGEWICISYL